VVRRVRREGWDERVLRIAGDVAGWVGVCA
jgi:hypothetical protein